ncbi:MAG: aminotransferase class V-fold PLP-dependent enzyme [Planctomycetia bacterium]|nr:aminotransferase class V-fold PLP-dependent enzyme [Planctomycetia bacterium]
MSIYDRYGVRPIINAAGAVTRLGGARMPAGVLEAFCEAARESVPLDQLQAAASRAIADVTGAEAGLVTAGACAALTLGTAAILCGYDIGRMERLPHCDGAFPDEIVVAREHRNGYDHGVRAAGARLVEVGFHEIVANAGVRRVEAWEYAAVFSPRTAGVYYALADDSRPPLVEVVACAHERGLPVLVDAAGELPPRKNLQAILATGADLVAFSGGKAIRGPQSTGILCGRRDLIASAALQMLDMDDHFALWDPPAELIDKSRVPGQPRHGIGRGHKVSKEEIVALLTALETFCRGDFDGDATQHRTILKDVAAGLADCPARCQVHDSRDGESSPWLEIAIDEARLGRSAVEVCRQLRGGEPPIHLGQARIYEGTLTLNPLLLRRDQVESLVNGLRRALSRP